MEFGSPNLFLTNKPSRLTRFISLPWLGRLRQLTKLATPDRRLALLIVGLACVLTGCADTARISQAEPISLAGPGERIWQLSQSELKARGFQLDRVDRRGGLIQTFPRTSGQFFEFWCHDVVTSEALLESSLHTVRRIITVEMHPVADNEFQLCCNAQVERIAVANEIVSGRIRTKDVFGGAVGRMPGLSTDRRAHQVPVDWVPLGRDGPLEQAILDSVRRKLGKAAPG